MDSSYIRRHLYLVHRNHIVIKKANVYHVNIIERKDRWENEW